MNRWAWRTAVLFAIAAGACAPKAEVQLAEGLEEIRPNPVNQRERIFMAPAVDIGLEHHDTVDLPVRFESSKGCFLELFVLDRDSGRLAGRDPVWFEVSVWSPEGERLGGTRAGTVMNRYAGEEGPWAAMMIDARWTPASAGKDGWFRVGRIRVERRGGIGGSLMMRPTLVIMSDASWAM